MMLVMVHSHHLGCAGLAKSYRIAGYLPSERGLMTKYHSEFIALQLIGCQYKVCAFLENENRSHRKFLHFSKMQTIAVLFLWVTC